MTSLPPWVIKMWSIRGRPVLLIAAGGVLSSSAGGGEISKCVPTGGSSGRFCEVAPDGGW
jgi:hypothetical protein